MSKLDLPPTERDHLRGLLAAPVTLVEYGDFECPYSGQAHTVVKELEEEMEAQLCVAYRHFPLTTIHPHAEPAALAAEAAGAQGRFWEMHDLLFRNQDALDDDDLRRYADALELDLARFDEDLQRRRSLPRIQEDFLSGVRSRVNGTPTFFINGRRYDGGWEYRELYPAVRQAAVLRSS